MNEQLNEIFDRIWAGFLALVALAIVCVVIIFIAVISKWLFFLMIFLFFCYIIGTLVE